jgi:hypothetical protein
MIIPLSFNISFAAMSIQNRSAWRGEARTARVALQTAPPVQQDA